MEPSKRSNTVADGQYTVACPACHGGKISATSLACPQCPYVAELDGRILVLERSPTADYSRDGTIAQSEVLDSHFWFKSRTKLIEAAISRGVRATRGQQFVEYGCSNGYVMSSLEAAGWDVAGVDMHIEGLRNARARARGPLICARIESVSFAEPVDAIGLFDVIEHLEDDEALLRHAREQLAPGGVVVVTVPAMMSLWSSFDVMLGHKRRYSRKELISLFERVNLDVVHVHHAFSFAVPLLWLQRRVLGLGKKPPTDSRRHFMKPPNPWLNRVLSALASVERWFIGLGVAPPLGTSLLGIAKRPE
jgi:SAM-dependent methyltransferase